MATSQKKIEKNTNELSKMRDWWDRRFGIPPGYLTDLIVKSGIIKEMSKHGHKFDSLAARKRFYCGDGNIFDETGLILENDGEVMTVEIKKHLRTDDVDYQVKRLKRLRKGEKEAKIEGKSLISGVAGLSIDEDARKEAKALGMYVIRLIEDEKKIKVEAPDKGVGRW